MATQVQVKIMKPDPALTAKAFAARFATPAQKAKLKPAKKMDAEDVADKKAGKYSAKEEAAENAKGK